ncbi:MAG: transposase, partial [Candidatus Zixiibacteriota bacterium]
MPRLRHYDNLNTARIITVSCFRRLKLLTDPTVISVFLRTLDSTRSRCGVHLFGCVIMPEHVHLVLHPPDSLTLGPVIGELKSKSASRIIADALIDLPESCWIFKDGRKRCAFW